MLRVPIKGYGHAMRTSVGLDITLLHAADSYIKRLQNATYSTDSDFKWRAREFDPDARHQFVEAVDIYLDLPHTF